MGDQIVRQPHDVLNLWSSIDGYLVPLFSYLSGSKSQIPLKNATSKRQKNSINVRLSYNDKYRLTIITGPIDETKAD